MITLKLKISRSELGVAQGIYEALSKSTQAAFRGTKGILGVYRTLHYEVQKLTNSPLTGGYKMPHTKTQGVCWLKKVQSIPSILLEKTFEKKNC